MYYRRNARGAQGGVLTHPYPDFFGTAYPDFPPGPKRREGEKHFRPLRKAPWTFSAQDPNRAKGAFPARFRDGAHGSAAKTTAGTWLGRGRGWGGDVAGTCGRGRRPGGPPPARNVRQPRAEGGVGTAATSAALPHGTARFHFGTHVFPHPATRCCKMRFHRVIILKAIAPRGGFDTCGLPRGCLGGPGSARSGCVPGSCPSRACRDLHYIPVRSAGGRRHGPPPRKSGKEGERTVSLSTGKEAPQDALLSTESIEVRHLVPKGFLSIRQTGIYWLAMKNIVSAFICFLLLLCMDSPQQLHCRECLSSQHCLLRLRHYFRS